MPLRKIAKKTILTDEREEKIHFFFQIKKEKLFNGMKEILVFVYLFVCSERVFDAERNEEKNIS